MLKFIKILVFNVKILILLSHFCFPRSTFWLRGQNVSIFGYLRTNLIRICQYFGLEVKRCKNFRFLRSKCVNFGHFRVKRCQHFGFKPNKCQKFVEIYQNSSFQCQNFGFVGQNVSIFGYLRTNFVKNLSIFWFTGQKMSKFYSFKVKIMVLRSKYVKFGLFKVKMLVFQSKLVSFKVTVSVLTIDVTHKVSIISPPISVSF